ncbi:hypothetical protein Aph01nite_46000 [Acrocarpospora phusangensis]|uniref:Galactose mutarotase n=1 Tax=Acrocarpospora phusangensis TaxID=1070424 RepID=A0A919QGY9_9ACTN|nr:hypothetical protein [Acrocarpospora phusangensis]GIH26290.1 hypothetical protein Aph01nite_46000 [Acrocarpospora phusangensis]
MSTGGIDLRVDAEHGGRWTSLRGPDGKEWLWRRDAPERDRVRPGDAFVDAGGLEECFPTVSGEPDHGDVWSRRWEPDGDGLAVEGADYRLRRAIVVDDTGITASYELRAEPGRRFIWAAHALLDLSGQARLLLPEGHPMDVSTDDADFTAGWPDADGVDVSALGPDDGSVTFCMMAGLNEATVRDGDSTLTMRLEVEGQPTAIALWRNLGGWPEAGPYRSIGVEPMIGARAGLIRAEPGRAGVVPPDGEVRWTLRMTAS